MSKIERIVAAALRRLDRAMVRLEQAELSERQAEEPLTEIRGGAA